MVPATAVVRDSEAMVLTNTFKFTVYIVCTARAKVSYSLYYEISHAVNIIVSDCIVYTVKFHIL